MGGQALGAQAAEIARVLLVAADLATWPSLTLMTMPHPTPQYGQTLRTSLLLMGDLL
jgi:hypothetical protein